MDNIPGAPGIGDKGARDLIARFGSVENAIEHAAEVERKTYRESLQNHREQILLSKRLATIHTDVPVEVQFESLVMREMDVDALRELYRTLEFSSLLRDLGAARLQSSPAARLSATRIEGRTGCVAENASVPMRPLRSL